MPMLKLAKDDPKKELEFNVKCSLKMSQDDRVHKLLELSEAMLKLAKRYETRRPDRIIKRQLS